jgi:hypothetical protein
MHTLGRYVWVVTLLAATRVAAQVPAALDADLERSVIRRAPQGRYAMYGGLTKLSDGEVSCVFKVGSLDPKTHSPWTVRDETIVAVRSTGGGRFWPAEDTVIYQDRKTRQENCCGTGYRAADGTLRHAFYILNSDYEEQAQAQNWSHVYLAESADGLRWSTRKLDVPLHIAASFGGMLRIDDGTVLLGVYGSAVKGSFRHQAALLRSRDDGRTWADYTIIGATADPDGGPARLNETSVAQIADGRLISMSRTQYPGFPLYRGVSSDRGRTWKVDPSGLTGLCPAVCFTRSGPPEGVLAVVYHDRWGRHAKQGGVYAAFSTNGGATWGEPVWIDHGAYPCAIALEPGRMMVSYYRSSTVLAAVRFAVPFPSGLRAERLAPGAALRVCWDLYQGPAASQIEYTVHRDARPDFSPGQGNQVAHVRSGHEWLDTPPLSGNVYYRVVARQAGRPIGTSWLAHGSGDPRP